MTYPTNKIDWTFLERGPQGRFSSMTCRRCGASTRVVDGPIRLGDFLRFVESFNSRHVDCKEVSDGGGPTAL